MVKTILITGATSGIGKALSLEYAKPGITLFLTGRNQKNLQEIANSCELKGAQVIAKIIDVKEKEELAKWIAQISKKFGLDLVVANAGISAGTASGIESDAQIAEIFETNVTGVLNTINPVIPFMQKQKSGQIALVSSLAGFRGLPSSPAYSASKAAVRVYGEGLRGNLSRFGIKVSVICPGYVKTPMTDVNNFPMPFLMSSDKAARIIKFGLEKNKSRISFPFPFYFLVWFLTLLSPRITDPLFARLPKKSVLKKK